MYKRTKEAGKSKIERCLFWWVKEKMRLCFTDSRHVLRVVGVVVHEDQSKATDQADQGHVVNG